MDPLTPKAFAANLAAIRQHIDNPNGGSRSVANRALQWLEEIAAPRSHYDLAYQNLSSTESCGQYGSIGVKILVGGTNLPDLDSSAIWGAGHDAIEKVTAAVMEATLAADPKAQAHRAAERAQIVGLFGDRLIYVEEIPNGYSNGWYAKHLPWFVITTSVGRFTVGWRKRVISIDWTATVGTKTSADLFAAEDVTKEKRLIHAWSVEKAAAYIAAIIGSAAN